MTRYVVEGGPEELRPGVPRIVRCLLHHGTEPARGRRVDKVCVSSTSRYGIVSYVREPFSCRFIPG